MLLIFLLLHVHVFRLSEIRNIFSILDSFQKVAPEIFPVINECSVCLSVCLSSSPALSTISLFFSALISKLLNSYLYLNKDLNRDLLTSLVFVMILSTVTIESPVFTLFYASKDQRCRLVGGYDRIAYVISSDLKFLDIAKCRCYLH